MKLSRALPLLPLLPLLAALAGCINVGPDYALPKQALVNAPLANTPIEGADEKLTSQQNVPAVWWKLYDDSVLNGLVDEALKSNTDLRVAAANLARSREALGVAQAQGGFSGKASALVARAQESAEQYLMFAKYRSPTKAISASASRTKSICSASCGAACKPRRRTASPCRPPPISPA